MGAASAAQPAAEPAWKAELAKAKEERETVIETSKDADGTAEIVATAAKENTMPRRASVADKAARLAGLSASQLAGAPRPRAARASSL